MQLLHENAGDNTVMNLMLDEIFENELINNLLQKEEITEYLNKVYESNRAVYEHNIRVARMAVHVAASLNLSEVEMVEIGVGALLHDIGLCAINVPYMEIDQESYTPEQMFEYKKHTLYGIEEVERDYRISNESKKIILFHHEKKDKSGYPFQQDNITINSIGVKIVAVVDSFENRVSGIGHRKVSAEKAMNYVRLNRDNYFDERVVDCFFKIYEEENKCINS